MALRNSPWMPAVLLLALVSATASIGRAQGPPPGSAGGAPVQKGAAPAVPTPAIEPQAERMLRDASDYLKSAPQLSFHADITYDDLLPTGQKVQLAAAYEVAVRRPDRVYTGYWGDAGTRRLWYDGKNVTLYDPTLGVYATEAAKPTIDATLDQLIDELGFTPPLSDLMTSDPGATLHKDVLFGFDVGATEVDGVHCRHLVFVEQYIDWQVWIEEGTQLVPRKIVITYKTIPGAPQFSAVISDWDFATRPPDALFTPQLPPEAARISFLKAAAPAKAEASGGKTK